jgi:amidophosphoribosyltransferase
LKEQFPINDKPKEECGVFAVYSHKEDVARLTYFGLHALQHRGQESAGIAVSDGKSIFVVKDMGLVPQVFNETNLAALQGGYSAIGHVRYSTTGSTHWENAQPVHKTFSDGSLALAHNGNLTNTKYLRQMLQKNGSRFRSTSDTEVMADLLASFVGDGHIEDAVIRSMELLEGAYSVVMLTEEKLIAFRDARGIRPLSIGTIKDGYVVSSETCGLDIIGAEFLDDVKPGEMVVIDENGLKRRRVLNAKPAMCIFEYIYFSRPDSQIDGKSLYYARKTMGKYLAKESPVDADIVIGVPDSGIPAAIGYAEESGIPYGEGLVKNRYVGRTFIQPEQIFREVGIKMKLNPLVEAIKDKKIIVVDDSIVRGNTTRKIVKLLKRSGAKEVHMRISSPPYSYPCFYGIDTTSVDHLIAHNEEVEKIKEHIKADSLAYLSLDSLVKATGKKLNEFCAACLNGKYPIKVSKDLKLTKFVLEDEKVKARK